MVEVPKTKYVIWLEHDLTKLYGTNSWLKAIWLEFIIGLGSFIRLDPQRVCTVVRSEADLKKLKKKKRKK